MKKPIRWTLSIYGPMVLLGMMLVMTVASVWPRSLSVQHSTPPFSDFFASGGKRFYEHVAAVYASGKNLELSEDYPVAWDSLSIHYRPLDITFPGNAQMLDQVAGLPIYDLEGGKSLLVFYHGDKIVDTVIYFSNEVIFFDGQGVQIQALTLPRSDARFTVKQNEAKGSIARYDCYLLKEAVHPGGV